MHRFSLFSFSKVLCLALVFQLTWPVGFVWSNDEDGVGVPPASTEAGVPPSVGITHSEPNAPRRYLPGHIRAILEKLHGCAELPACTTQNGVPYRDQNLCSLTEQERSELARYMRHLDAAETQAIGALRIIRNASALIMPYFTSLCLSMLMTIGVLSPEDTSDAVLWGVPALVGILAVFGFHRAVRQSAQNSHLHRWFRADGFDPARVRELMDEQNVHNRGWFIHAMNQARGRIRRFRRSATAATVRQIDRLVLPAEPPVNAAPNVPAATANAVPHEPPAAVNPSVGTSTSTVVAQSEHPRDDRTRVRVAPEGIPIRINANGTPCVPSATVDEVSAAAEEFAAEQEARGRAGHRRAALPAMTQATASRPTARPRRPVIYDNRTVTPPFHNEVRASEAFSTAPAVIPSPSTAGALRPATLPAAAH